MKSCYGCKYTQDYWLIMHKEGFRANKWTKVGPNLGTKAIFFPITWRTLPKKTRKFPAKPRNIYFFLLKHALFIPISYNIIHKHVWTKILTKKHQSIKIKHEVPNKKKTINLKQHKCSCNMDSKLIFWTHFVLEQA